MHSMIDVWNTLICVFLIISAFSLGITGMAWLCTHDDYGAAGSPFFGIFWTVFKFGLIIFGVIALGMFAWAFSVGMIGV